MTASHVSAPFIRMHVHHTHHGRLWRWLRVLGRWLP
jgi:hypothetical protein